MWRRLTARDRERAKESPRDSIESLALSGTLQCTGALDGALYPGLVDTQIYLRYLWHLATLLTKASLTLSLVDEYARRANKINYILLLQNQVRLSPFKWPIDEGDWPSRMSPSPLPVSVPIPAPRTRRRVRVDSIHRTPSSLHCEAPILLSASLPLGPLLILLLFNEAANLWTFINISKMAKASSIARLHRFASRILLCFR